MSPTVTIATISETRLAWGTILLIASLRKAGLSNRVEVFMTDSDPETERCLTQFGNVGVQWLDMRDDCRNPCLRKPQVLLTLEGDYIAWFDNDTMAIGNIAPYLEPLNGQFQIRLRSPSENADVFRKHYGPGDPPGPVPRSIL